jgi:maltooligosyltrehalose synthase
MPKIPRLLSGYDIHMGLTLYGYDLIDVTGEHIQIHRFQEYKYNIVMVWQRISKNANSYDLVHELDNMIAEPRIVKSEYNNTYHCQMGEITIHPDSTDNQLVLLFTGKCRKHR